MTKIKVEYNKEHTLIQKEIISEVGMPKKNSSVRFFKSGLCESSSTTLDKVFQIKGRCIAHAMKERAGLLSSKWFLEVVPPE